MSIRDFDAKRALLVMFICRHCPYVKHVAAELARLGRDFADSELAIVAISSNDPDEYPEDAPERLAEDAREAGYAFPYLFDETQAVAKAYRRRARPTSSCSTPTARSSTGGSSTTAARATGSRSPARTSAPAIDAVLVGRTGLAGPAREHRLQHQVAPGNEPAYA